MTATTPGLNGYRPPAERLRRFREMEAEVATLPVDLRDGWAEHDAARMRLTIWFSRSILRVPGASIRSTSDERARARRQVARADWKKRRNVKRRVSARFRRIVIERANGRCAYCGGIVPEGGLPDRYFEIDHILPVRWGGRSKLSNLIAACWDCNREKKDDIWEPLYYPPGFYWPVQESYFRPEYVKIEWKRGE